jgi:hypothetical protein
MTRLKASMRLGARNWNRQPRAPGSDVSGS